MKRLRGRVVRVLLHRYSAGYFENVSNKLRTTKSDQINITKTEQQNTKHASKQASTMRDAEKITKHRETKSDERNIAKKQNNKIRTT